MISEVHHIKTISETGIRTPQISVVIPFDTRSTSKDKVQNHLKMVVKEVEKQMVHGIPKNMVRPALSRLRSVINGLDFSTPGKSLAIFLSPFSEKVIYLNIAVSEKIVVGRPLSIRDLLGQKKEEKNLLALWLNGDSAIVYLIQNKTVQPILFNTKKQISMKGSALSANSFLSYVDANLSILLNAWRLPVVLIGCHEELSEYRSLSIHLNEIMKSVSIEKSLLDTPVEQLLPTLLSNWPANKEHYILQQLDKALEKNKLSVGISDVWQAAFFKRSNLLVVEEDYSFPAYFGQDGQMQYADAIPLNNSVLIDDAVEHIMEKVLVDGGDVELVRKGALKDYLHISLLCH